MEEFPPLFNRTSIAVLFFLCAAEFFLWFQVCSLRTYPVAHAYFLDVGQGDGELIVFANGVKVMTDAGPDAKVMQSLTAALGPNDTYIDLAIISHPQLDHFNGYSFMLDHYRIGAFVYNGRDDDPGVKAWPEFLAKIKQQKIPLITLGRGDTIHYGKNLIDFLSPDRNFDESAELNDTGFVELVQTPEFRALFTGDTGFNIEDFLLAHEDIHADILKVGHHGSKYSSGNDFLRAVNPEVAVIEVGAKNTYGHPAKETLGRLASSTTARVFRTDEDGTIDVWAEDGKFFARRE